MKAPAALVIAGALLLYLDFTMLAYLEVSTSGRVGYLLTMLPWLLAFAVAHHGAMTDREAGWTVGPPPSIPVS